MYGKIPPQANDLEEAVLGAIMLEKTKLQEVLEIIPHEECFYTMSHQKIFEAIKEIEQIGMPVDLLTVTEGLRKNGNLEIVGGAFFLSKLTMNVVSSAHVEAHARIIMEKYMARELITVSGTVINGAYDDTVDVFDLLDFAEVKIADITGANITQNYKGVTELARQQMERLQINAARTSDHIGIDTGFYYLNQYTKGWQAPDMIVVAARPSVGKTAFALNIALNAMRSGIGVGFFSLEMSDWQITNRLMASMSGVELEVVQSGKMTADELVKYNRALEEFMTFNFKIDDTAGLNSMQLRSKARRMINRDGVGMIIVDYLQLMEPNFREKQASREQVVSGISRDLKKLAKEMNVPIIPLSQLNRAVENRASKIPNLSDLRESGAIEQDADVVMFLYGPKQTDANDEGGEMYDPLNLPRFIDIAKNRSGSCETLKLSYNQRTQKMKDYDESLSYGAFKPVVKNNIDWEPS